MPIITHYGYSDGSGEFYVVIDAARCNGCGKCIEKCPQKALEMTTLFVDLEDKAVVAVTEQHRKKIKYTCSSCKPENGSSPCVVSCAPRAITCVWNQR